MMPTPEVQERLRQYLLGQLNDDAREEIERDLLVNDELFEELLVIEDEIIDDYLANILGRDDRAAFETHFLSTPDRHDQLKFGRAFNRRLSSESVAAATQAEPSGSLPTRSWSPPFSPLSKWMPAVFSSPLRVAVAVVIVIGIALGVWQLFFHQSEVDKGLVALNAAYREQRPVESRISKFDYAPYVVTRGPGDEKIDQNELRRAELTLLDALKNNPTPAAYHALGKVYLAKGDFDKAIGNFDEALKADPKNAQIWSDLGAAWLEKGKIDHREPKAGQDLEDFARSLDYISRAIELNQNLLEAFFNRAFVHQEMMLPEQAETDWKEYLQKDSTSKWATEARENLKLLEEQKRKTSRTREELLQEFLRAYATSDDERAWQVLRISREALSRKLIWEQLLDQYLTASAADNKADAKDSWQALSYEGNLEQRRAGDQFVLDLARFYRATTDSQRQALVQARGLMKQGHEYYFQQKLDKAEEAYINARQAFAAVADDCETQYAQHWIAYAEYERGKTQPSLARLEELAKTLQKENYQWLLMRTVNIASSAYLNLNEYSKAINYNRRALALAEHIDDKIGIFNASSILIFQYSNTGNYRQAFDYVQRSLSVMNDCPLNEIQFARHFTTTASAFDRAGFYHAAIDYQKEGLRRAIAIGHSQHTSTDYARLGLMYAKLGDFAEAHQNLELAYNTAQSDPDVGSRKDMMAFATLQTGHLFREQGDFYKALSSYDQFIALSDPVNFQFEVYEAHKNRLFCYLSLGSPAAGDELKMTLDLAERYRSTIVEADNRNDFFDIQQTVYDLAIDFYSRTNDPQKAFQYSEQSRSRSLLDSVVGKSEVSDESQTSDITFASVAQPLSLAEIQARLPANAQILQYAVLNDKVMIWLISRDQFLPIEKSITQRELEKKVVDYIRIVSALSPGNEVESSAQELFEILIEPAQFMLDKSKPLYLIPDKFLNALPFATLVSPATGKFLVEDYLLETSPSSSLLVFLSERAGKKNGSRDEKLLSVGNPRFDRNVYPTLSELPAADREAEAVAAYYDSPRVLIGSAATLSKVNAEMPGADVIHFALHSVVDEQAPMHSRLILANDAATSSDRSTSDGSLEASEIYRLKLPRTRLAVLSACQTGAERYYGGEGMISLARPFLAAGVPLVVVSLWPVDSNSTASLMISFHKYRKQGNLSSAEALRQAQLDLLKGPEEEFHRPFFWGAFVLIGGSISF